MLAACHAIGRNAVIDSDVATFLADFLLKNYPPMIAARYGFNTDIMNGVGVLEAVAIKRGCVQQRRGKALDLEKAAMIFLTDFRAGKLGRITLETPASRSAMLAQANKESSAATECLPVRN